MFADALARYGIRSSGGIAASSARPAQGVWGLRLRNARPFAALRIAHGDPEPALDPVELADRWEEELQDLAATGGLRTVVLHPFLMLDERWSTGVARLFGVAASSFHDPGSARIRRAN